jgi:molybdopterin-guanine dinucleotide biosynthesis protein A
LGEALNKLRQAQNAHRILHLSEPVKRNPQIGAFILAGGFSSRMGREKALLEIGGVPLIVRTVQTVEPLVSEATVVGPPDRYAGLGLRSIPDEKIPGLPGGERQTPLAGIATALNTTNAAWNLILACDLPFLTRDWLDWLLARATASEAQIVVPRSAAGLEPLAAVYRKECSAGISAALLRGVRKVTDAVNDFQIEILLETEWKAHDPEGRVLRNMNTPAEYEEARRWIEAK